MAPHGTWLCAHLSDSHVVSATDRPVVPGLDTTATLEAAVATVNALDPQPDLVVHSGDLVNAGRGAQYERAAYVLAGLRAPLRLVPGNHDDRDALRLAFPAHVHDRTGTGTGHGHGHHRLGGRGPGAGHRARQPGAGFRRRRSAP